MAQSNFSGFHTLLLRQPLQHTRSSSTFTDVTFIRVGNLRFAAPQNPISFEGVRQATTYGAACPQAAFGGGPGGPPTVNDSEDCESIDFFPCENIPTFLLPRPLC